MDMQVLEVSNVGKMPFDRATAQYTHVVIRRDISVEQQVVQGIHAAMAATAQFGGLTSETRLVLMSVEDEEELLSLADKLHYSNIEFSLFKEPDYKMGFSALATSPGIISDRKMFKKLPLWKAGKDK